jgi:hypothetical protein
MGQLVECFTETLGPSQNGQVVECFTETLGPSQKTALSHPRNQSENSIESPKKNDFASMGCVCVCVCVCPFM